MPSRFTREESHVELLDTVPLASFEVQQTALHELVFVRMTPIEPQVAEGRRIYAMNLGQAVAMRDGLDEAIGILRRELRAAAGAR
jgi:hypothetical protein